MIMSENELAPVTPGEMLKEEFLTEYGLSQNQLAKAVGISPNRIAEIVNNRRRITADTALRLGLYFGNSPEFWRFIQNSGLLPKYKPRRSAVSAVIRRLLFTISAIRFGEMPTAFASWFCDRPYSVRNSSLSISPGVTGASSLSAIIVSCQW